MESVTATITSVPSLTPPVEFLSSSWWQGVQGIGTLITLLVMLIGGVVTAIRARRGSANRQGKEQFASVVPFKVRPVCGEFPYSEGDEAYAQLAISNQGALLKKCLVTLQELSYIETSSGYLLDEHIQPRPLHWSSRETTAYGDFNELLDIANDGREHFLDVAAVHISSLDRFVIVSANHEDRLAFGAGWYKVVVVIASESETPNPKRIELLLGLHPRERWGVPAPIQLYDWEYWESNSTNLLKELRRKVAD